MMRATRKLIISLVTAVVAGCSSNNGDIGPTIADLEEQPPIFETLEIEPQATFDIDPQQVIESFRSLVEITAESGVGTGDEMRRLADLELEASLDDRLSENADTQQQGLDASVDAIAIYKYYLESYPDREDNDLILYQLSRAYALESESEKSLAMLDRIARDYPNSRYLDEVQFRRGENLFVARNYASAEQAYGVIVNHHPESIFFEKAIYKYAWTQFKQNRYRDALKSYTKLLDVNYELKKIGELKLNPNLTRAQQELLNDVIRVVSLSFSYQDEEIYIADYFKQTGRRDYEPLLYWNLAELYLSKDRVTDGSDLFLAYGKENPNSSHTPHFHQRAIEIYQQAGYSDLVLKEKMAFVDRYDVGSQYWSLQSLETQQQLKPTLSVHMSELATHFHALARTSKKTQDFQVSANWYRRYLKSFPDDSKAARMNFLLAESLYDARQYPAAIDEYEKTAYAYADHKDSAEAGYASLVAFDALFKKTNASQILLLRQKRIKSAVRFTTTFPDDARIYAVELQTAQQFFEWKDYKQATQSAKRLISNKNIDKGSKQTAWTIVADSQFSGADYVSAETSYQTLLSFLGKADKKRTAVREQIASSIYKQGEIARTNNDHAGAAKHFTRLGSVIPESPKRIVADYDAATAYIQLKDWPATIRQLEAFRKKYPKNKKWNAGVTEKLALAYSESGNQSLAAKEMVGLSKLTTSAGRKKELLWGAAELYEQAGNQNQAIAIYKSYVKTYPYPLERSIELRHKIAESYRVKNDSKNLHFWLKDIVKADARAKSERSPRSKYLAATASLELIGPLHRSYEKAKLTIPLKTSLKKKKNLMQRSIDAYSKAMKYQVEEVTTEATFQIAEIYHNFAKSLLKSQRPKGLSEDQLEEYDLLLEEQAFPFEEKAIDIHLANFKRIPSGTFDEPTKKSLKILGELMPFRFARAESTDVYVELQ